MRFKYKYEHLDCGLCAELSDGGCPYLFCPHIMENLKDLRHDPAFMEAVGNAERCDCSHKAALLLLQSRGFTSEVPEQAAPVPVQNTPTCGFKPECAGCPFPSHGFICYSERDGSCMKTDVDRIMGRGRATCRA